MTILDCAKIFLGSHQCNEMSSINTFQKGYNDGLIVTVAKKCRNRKCKKINYF